MQINRRSSAHLLLKNNEDKEEWRKWKRRSPAFVSSLLFTRRLRIISIYTHAHSLGLSAGIRITVKAISFIVMYITSYSCKFSYMQTWDSWNSCVEERGTFEKMPQHLPDFHSTDRGKWTIGSSLLSVLATIDKVSFPSSDQLISITFQERHMWEKYRRQIAAVHLRSQK